MKLRISALLLLVILMLSSTACADKLEPRWPVEEPIEWVLDTARHEIGYKEGAHGYSKYGEWAGDPYAQWCAEFLCWCVDQVDQSHGTHLLKNQYPLYSGQNVGRNWFIEQGRYVAANGNLDGWGYQWLIGEDHFLSRGDYIPQPGDWVFFTWTSGKDTDHVALVEYCVKEKNGSITVHVIEGNAPVSVARNKYKLTDRSILGFGTVRRVCYTTLKHYCSG